MMLGHQVFFEILNLIKGVLTLSQSLKHRKRIIITLTVFKSRCYNTKLIIRDDFTSLTQ